MAKKKYFTDESLSTLVDETKSYVDSVASTKADKTHTHSISDITGLQSSLDSKTNQNAFSNVKIGSTTISADAVTDTLTLVAGDNITLTPNATSDSITISSKDTTYTLSSFGITATATELNKLDGVTATTTQINYLNSATGNIQTQLDGKSNTGHTHNYAGSSSAGGAATSANKVNKSLTIQLNGGTTEGTNKFTFDGSAAKSFNITASSVGASASGHTHDDRYYTESEIDSKVSTINNSISGKANSSHTHTIANITNLQTTLDGKSSTSHTHSYAGSSSVGGSATSAVKLDTSTAGDSNTPVYFSGGKPVACTSLDLNTSGSSASCTGNSATATKLQTARTIALGTGATGTATSFNGTANITIPVTDVKESYLSWGGKNISGGVSPIDAACSNVHSANRFAFAKADGITIEYSTNGSTYTTYSTTDSAKINLVSGVGNTYYIGGRSTSTTVNDKLRITLNATNMGLYTRLRKLLINISTSYATGSNVIIEKAMKGSETTFTTIGTYQISGWSGWNSIPIEAAFGGGSNQTSNIAVLRLTFGITGVNSEQTSNALQVMDIIGIGDTYWSYPSTMAKTGHLYTYDSGQNATFPAKVTATTFAGALSGNATSATTASSCTGNSATATKLATARTISLTGDVTGSASFDGSANASITATVADDSHNHVISNVDGLQSALDVKSDNDHRHYPIPISVTGQNLNDYTDAGFYTFAAAYAPTNAPSGNTNGWLLVIPWVQGNATIKQIWFRHGSLGTNDTETYVRTKIGTYGWSDWSRYYTTSGGTITGNVVLSNADLYAGNVYLNENGSDTGKIFAKNSSGSYVANIQPCNENGNCVIGYGNYDKGSGDTNIYGNNVHIYAVNSDGSKPSGAVFVGRNDSNHTLINHEAHLNTSKVSDTYIYGRAVHIDTNDTNFIVDSIQLAHTDKATITSYSSGWSVYGTNTTPTVRRYGKVVTLTGALKNTSTITLNTDHVKVFTIPSGYRPSQDLIVVCQGSGISKFLIQIQTDGSVSFGRYGTNAYNEVGSGAWFTFHATWIME